MRTTPVPVEGGHRFVEVSAGLYHTCALTSEEQVFCWGRNAAGQLGDASTTDRLTPVLMEGGHGFVQLSAAFSHTCALASAGQLYCWGRNSVGQLGDGTTTGRLTPVLVRIPGEGT
jgi:alpha-tubulin suppressor-like RCC1 family protein